MITSLFPLVFFLISSNKELVVFLLLFLIYLLFIQNYSIEKSIFLSLLFFLPFEKGLRGWNQVVAVADFWQKESYSFYFGINLKLVLALILVVFLLLKKKSLLVKKNYLFFLSLWLIFAFLSTLFRLDSGVTVLLGFIKIVFLVSLFLFGMFFFRQPKVKIFFSNLMIGWGNFFGLLAIWQYVNKSVVGLFIEESTTFAPLGYTTNQSQFLFRPSGHTGHPTFFASFLSMVFIYDLNLLLKQKQKLKLPYLLNLGACVFSFLAIIMTYSRSSWLAIFLAFVILVLFYFKKVAGFRKIFAKIKIWLIVVLPLSLVLISNILLRLDSIFYVFSLGTGKGRIQLVQEAWQMIKKFPLWGVGLNQFTPVMIQQNVSGAAEYFLYPVHNTWLLFASEIGLLGLGSILAFIALVLKKVQVNQSTIGPILAIFTFGLNSQFHTLFNQDASIDLFIIVLALLAVQFYEFKHNHT